MFCFKHDETIELPKNVSVHKFNMSWVPKPFRHKYFSHLLEKEKVKVQFDLALSLGRTSHQHAVLAPGNHIGYLKALGRSARSVSDFEQITMDRKAYASSSKILAASQLMADELPQQFGVDKDSIHVLYPPINAGRLASKADQISKSEAREVLGLDQGKKTVAVISTGHLMKRVPFILEVMRHVPEVQLVVAGSPLSDPPPNVKYLGFLKEPSMVYRAADATILASFYEAFGQVVAESLYCGTPVIVSEMVGAKEIIPEGFGQILSVKDQTAWINAILTIKEKPELDEPLIDLKPLSVESHMKKLCEIVGLNL